MFNLKAFDSFCDIVIQCHDNPDADAVGSGYALYKYFESQGKNVRLVYSGKNAISKINMVNLIRLLQIPVEQVAADFECPELLITVDCQYGSGNLTLLKAPVVAVIDHHVPDPKRLPNKFEYIKSNYGSCATVIYQLLLETDYPLKTDTNVATALYYGLYMDTGELSEIRHPADKDARDDLKFDDKIINVLQNSNLSLDEFAIAGKALSNCKYFEKRRLAVIEAEPCDVNILGFIADLLLKVDGVDVGIVYANLGDAYKLSIRSCVNEVKSNELAQSVTLGVGGGGGHFKKAGGYINKSLLASKYSNFTSLPTFLYEVFCNFYDSFDYIYATDFIINESFKPYRKKSFVIGYVKSTDIAEVGDSIFMRTFEGDDTELADYDLYIMIGIIGEVYPIRKDVFDKKYVPCDSPVDIEFDYEPRVKNIDRDEVIRVSKHMKPCRNTCNSRVFAKKIDRETKVFNAWNYENYLHGFIGDYLVCREEQPSDVFIVKHDIFDRIYEPA
jgi:bifunctional oligoribonuclease and PAP phosphatase NrnA